MNGPQTVICTFRVKNESMGDFRPLLDRHWPVLLKLGFVTETPEQIYVGADEGGPTVVSIFEWVNDDAVNQAHHHPDVAEIWEAMDPLCESRDGRPSMEFPHFLPSPPAR